MRPVVAFGVVLLVTGVGFEWIAFRIGSAPIGLVAYILVKVTRGHLNCNAIDSGTETVPLVSSRVKRLVGNNRSLSQKYKYFTCSLVACLSKSLTYSSTLQLLQLLIIQMMPLSAFDATLGLVRRGSYSLACSLGCIDAVTWAFVFCSLFFGIPTALLLTLFTISHLSKCSAPA